MDIVKLTNPEVVAENAADKWVSIASQAVEERGTFSIALSGGSTPRLLYKLMAAPPRSEQAPWADTHIFWGDERRVPHSDPSSNYRMAREALIDHVPVPPDHVHPMDGTGLANSASRDYQEVMRRYFRFERREWPRFDLILLGLGADGHTASIFPGTRAVSDLSNMVVAYQVPQLSSERITLTLPVINNARHVMFLVTGKDKAETVKAVVEGESRQSTYPAQAVRPVDGTLTWLLDHDAASALTR